ncbi:hypothetical protein AWB85_20335 [Mycobacteroides immunogenum]|uniref:Uncharacterized protein n=1 Tax=Mycobacteroides immunogenum TaxID=83262 RepID=A0A179VC21_9MYCO|nr:hypothetical protein AWB85_20335 [Mycobacteroides immunogenum]
MFTDGENQAMFVSDLHEDGLIDVIPGTEDEYCATDRDMGVYHVPNCTCRFVPVRHPVFDELSEWPGDSDA